MASGKIFFGSCLLTIELDCGVHLVHRRTTRILSTMKFVAKRKSGRPTGANKAGNATNILFGRMQAMKWRNGHAFGY